MYVVFNHLGLLCIDGLKWINSNLKLMEE